jgi:hypothetical protein
LHGHRALLACALLELLDTTLHHRGRLLKLGAGIALLDARKPKHRAAKVGVGRGRGGAVERSGCNLNRALGCPSAAHASYESKAAAAKAPLGTLDVLGLPYDVINVLPQLALLILAHL